MFGWGFPTAGGGTAPTPPTGLSEPPVQPVPAVWCTYYAPAELAGGGGVTYGGTGVDFKAIVQPQTPGAAFQSTGLELANPFKFFCGAGDPEAFAEGGKVECNEGAQDGAEFKLRYKAAHVYGDADMDHVVLYCEKREVR